MTLVSLLFALIAWMAPQNAPDPGSWSQLLSASRIVVVDGFIGREWSCGDETCYAGLDLDPIAFVSGP